MIAQLRGVSAKAEKERDDIPAFDESAAKQSEVAVQVIVSGKA